LNTEQNFGQGNGIFYIPTTVCIFKSVLFIEIAAYFICGSIS
jgi:hypothetical protein